MSWDGLPMALPFKAVQEEQTPLKGSKVTHRGFNIKQQILQGFRDNIAKHLETGNIFWLFNKPFLIPKTCFLSL